MPHNSRMYLRRQKLSEFKLFSGQDKSCFCSCGQKKGCNDPSVGLLWLKKLHTVYLLVTIAKNLRK
jgi:hypothetical protein